MLQKLLILLILFPQFAVSQKAADVVPPKPAYPRLLNDENAYAYYHKDWRRLEDKLINHQKRTGNQLVIVVIPSLRGMAIEDVAVQTLRNWGIGNKEDDNGLLLFIARSDRKIKIEIGYGLEGKVTDLASGIIIRNILEPGLAKFEYQLPPTRKDKGYLPVLERTIDALISLTGEVNEKAIQNTPVAKKNSIGKKRFFLLLYLLSAIAFFLIANIGWRLLNKKLSAKQ